MHCPQYYALRQGGKGGQWRSIRLYMAELDECSRRCIRVKDKEQTGLRPYTAGSVGSPHVTSNCDNPSRNELTHKVGRFIRRRCIQYPTAFLYAEFPPEFSQKLTSHFGFCFKKARNFLAMHFLCRAPIHSPIDKEWGRRYSGLVQSWKSSYRHNRQVWQSPF